MGQLLLMCERQPFGEGVEATAQLDPAQQRFQLWRDGELRAHADLRAFAAGVVNSPGSRANRVVAGGTGGSSG